MQTRHIAYILIGDPDPDRALSLSDTLTHAGYRCIQASDYNTVLGLVDKRRPDLVLLSGFVGAPTSMDIAGALKSASATENIPVVLLNSDMSDETMSLGKEIGVDDILPEGASDGEILTRLPRLIRSSVMFAELARRCDTARDMGLDVDPRAFHRHYTAAPLVMAVAFGAGDLDGLGDALDKSGLDCRREADPYKAADRLHEERFDAVVVATGLGANNLERVQYLCSHIRSNPRLFNLPILVLSDGGNEEMDALYRGGAAIVLPSSSSALRIATYIHMLVARQRQKWSLRDAFVATRKGDAADRCGKAYSAAFWDAHLARDLKNADERARNLSVAYITVPTLPRILEEYGEENADILAQQLADWMNGMTRIEDTVARIRQDAFAILLPDTSEYEANRVVHRIIGILHTSEFHLGEEVMQVIHAWVEGGVAGLQAGDEPGTLLERARAAAL